VQHITRVLRLEEGDIVTISDSTGTDYEAEIAHIEKDAVVCNILSQKKNSSESNIAVTIFQALPKGTKMEYIIQKNTELGVVKIVPCALSRCVVKLDNKDAKKKCERWQKIADEAAKQSGRGVIPEIGEVISFKAAVEEMKKSDSFTPSTSVKEKIFKKFRSYFE
ncbi:MAG: RsmE family RNA methyltransferase, partial [Paraprevotella sp.]|nr:RsmE family RNA methyltransferase [Paraprevotella sp.]